MRASPLEIFGWYGISAILGAYALSNFSVIEFKGGYTIFEPNRLRRDSGCGFIKIGVISLIRLVELSRWSKSGRQ